MRISEFIELSDRTTDAVSLFDLLVDAARLRGFNRVAYGALNYHDQLGLDLTAPAVILNYPITWQAHYFENNYQAIDPVVILSPIAAKPYRWDQLNQRLSLTSRQRTLMSEAREAGLANGISVPLHGPLGRAAVVSFASDGGDIDWESQVGRLNAIATQFHLKFGDLVRSAVPIQANPTWLSQREKDCLLWAAQGKSSWDIGTILGISENTVNYHLKNTMRKLGTNGRTVTVLKALKLKLIELSQVA